MRKHYWACIPGSSGPPAWTLDNCRIEWAETAKEAIQKAFGLGNTDNGPLAKYDIGVWLVKDLGSRVAPIQSDSKRRAMLMERALWFDPYSYRVQYPERLESEHGHHLANVEVIDKAFVVHRISSRTGEAVRLPHTFLPWHIDQLRTVIRRAATHQWNWRDWDSALKGIGVQVHE